MSSYRLDAHMHIMAEKRMKSGIRWAVKAGFNMGLDPETTTEEDLLRHIRDTGITYFFNFFFPIFPKTSVEILDWQTEFALRTPEALPFVSVHVHDGDPLPIVREALENRHFVGLKLHPYAQRLELSHPLLEPVYQYLEDTGAIFFVHTGYDAFYGRSGITPDLEQILQRHPKLITVAAHMLYPEIPKAFDWLERFPNLYLDGTGAVASADEDGLGETLYPLMERYADRVLYGSDYAMAIESVGASWKRFQEMPISDEAQKRIAWETPLELLKRRNWPFCGDLPARYRDVAYDKPKVQNRLSEV
ncbi:hypothetical protein CVV65_06155 [Kyrpidia spormannii]|uniref:Amidohydrolase-related domain-containing protein n=1 Tax=Kyrpidia spormannii TaxID=2055160 RepID=A0A2K8N7L6_9BACL|nr:MULTISPECIES: amidohydrolase family protein [Kyrpidia]ATY84580.1 hypothetical protein CVV65_06155 [Kyrpidia spormannii]MCL6577370.1 amidohydrolase [Kyrpidia sp.]